MKRLQISLEPELDRGLERVARADGVSKAEVVRRALREEIGALLAVEDDPIFAIIGIADDDDGPTDVAENHDKYLVEWELEKWSSQTPRSS